MTNDCANTMSTLFEPSFVINFLVSYLSSMQFNYVTVFNCWDSQDNRYLMGNLSEAAKFVQLVDLNDADLDFALLAHRVHRRNRTRIGVIFEFGCPSSRPMLHECAEKRCFSTSTHWVMFARNSNDSVLGELEYTDLYVDTELKVLSNSESNGISCLYDVYNNGFMLGGKLNVTFDRDLFAHDDGRIGLGKSTVDVLPKYQNRNILSDIGLRVGIESQLYSFSNITMEEVLQFFTSYKKPGTDVAARIGYMLTKALETDMKFKIDFKFRGKTMENGTSEGNAQSLKNKQIDLSISEATQLNLNELTYIQHFMAHRSIFIFRTPVRKGLADNIFTQPFTTKTWVAIAFIIILGSVVFKINFLAERQIMVDGASHENYPFSTMLTESLANFCQEGCEFINRSSSGRLSQMTLFICSIVVFNYYSSGFFSILMQGPQKSHIKTLEQLTDSQMLLGIHGTVEAEDFFRGSKHSEVRYMMEKKHYKGNLYVDPTTGINLVRGEAYAYHCGRTVAYDMIRELYDFSEMCDLNEVEVLPINLIGLMIRKDSPFRELFTIRLARLREVGAYKRFTELWITKKPECLVTSVISSISLEGALPLFLLLIAGTFTAFLAFALETGIIRAIGRWFG